MEYNKHGDLVDTEWKTQSLPSLGRVSSEQTLESSGDEFAALRRTAPTRMLKSRNTNGQKYKATDEEDLLEDQEADNQPLQYEPDPATQHDGQGHYEVKRRPQQAVVPAGAHHQQQPLPSYREPDLERGELAANSTVIEPVEHGELMEHPGPMQHQRPNYHDRYSYAGYEP